MNVEYELKRVAERYIHLINEYPQQAEELIPCDITNSTRVNDKIIYFLFLFLGEIYRQLPNNENHRNITIVLHGDGAPVVAVTGK